MQTTTDTPAPTARLGVANVQVRQTDCRTGWQVYADGRLYLTVRRRDEADRIARKLRGAS